MPWRHAHTRMPCGFFFAAYRAAEDEALPAWLLNEIRAEIGWFERHLPVPDRFQIAFPRRRERFGVCWFRHEAREHVSHAHYLAWLIEEAGQPVRRVRSRDPGVVLYGDPFQVVAQPDRRRGLH